MGIEPTTTCLEGRSSSTELPPLSYQYSPGGGPHQRYRRDGPFAVLLDSVREATYDGWCWRSQDLRQVLSPRPAEAKKPMGHPPP